MSNDELTPFERDVLAVLLRAEHPVMERLRRQAATCRATERRYSGVGFFTDLAVAADAPRVGFERFVLGDVLLELPGVAAGAGVILFVEDGRLSMLEGFTYDDPWPDRVDGYRIVASHPAGGSPTNLERADLALRAMELRP